jgi:hypothetical protein
MIGSSRIVYFELRAHWFLNPSKQPAGNYNVADWVTALKLTNIIRPWLRLLHHFQRDWSKHLASFRLLVCVTLTIVRLCVCISSSIVVRVERVLVKLIALRRVACVVAKH